MLLQYLEKYFNCLDRKVIASEKYDDGMPIGTSEYGITNANIAKIVYGDSNTKLKFRQIFRLSER